MEIRWNESGETLDHALGFIGQILPSSHGVYSDVEFLHKPSKTEV